MKSIKRLLQFGILAFALLGATASFSAQAASIRCEGCTNAQMRTKAQQTAIAGTHNVYSISTNVVRTYEVAYEPSDGWVAAQVGGAPADFLEIIDKFHDLYLESPSLHAMREINADTLGMPYQSVYGIAGSVTERTAVQNKLQSLDYWNQTLDMDHVWFLYKQLKNGVLSLFGLSSIGVAVDIVVVFSDGKATFRVDWSTGTVSYVPGSAATPGGQPVPESFASGYWDGEGDNLSPMPAYMESRGASIIRSYTGAGYSCHISGMVCGYYPQMRCTVSIRCQ